MTSKKKNSTRLGKASLRIHVNGDLKDENKPISHETECRRNVQVQKPVLTYEI